MTTVIAMKPLFQYVDGRAWRPAPSFGGKKIHLGVPATGTRHGYRRVVALCGRTMFAKPDGMYADHSEGKCLNCEKSRIRMAGNVPDQPPLVPLPIDAPETPVDGLLWAEPSCDPGVLRELGYEPVDDCFWELRWAA